VRAICSGSSYRHPECGRNSAPATVGRYCAGATSPARSSSLMAAPDETAAHARAPGRSVTHGNHRARQPAFAAVPLPQQATAPLPPLHPILPPGTGVGSCGRLLPRHTKAPIRAGYFDFAARRRGHPRRVGWSSIVRLGSAGSVRSPMAGIRASLSRRALYGRGPAGFSRLPIDGMTSNLVGAASAAAGLALIGARCLARRCAIALTAPPPAACATSCAVALSSPACRPPHRPSYG